VDANCEKCKHSLFDNLWGEYKCKKEQRICTESELVMGCSQFEPIGSKDTDPTPLHILHKGATFTPSVSDSGVISWTNDKGLTNPPPVNIKGPKGEEGPQGESGRTPIKGIDYYTPDEKHDFVSAVIAALPKYEGEIEEL
jgi:hypothetical protein